MNIRKLFFWLHLIIGCSAAVFIFLMSLTGVALTYERQLISMAEYNDYPAAELNSVRITVEKVVGIAKVYPSEKPVSVEFNAHENAPFVLKEGRKTIAYLNPYTGEKILEPGKNTKVFFRKLRAFHRWLTLDGKFSDTGRWVNGVANVVFILLILSGLYLWLPKKFKQRAFKQRLLLSKQHINTSARNYQWHHVFGFYMTPILFVIAFSAIFFSFKWPAQVLKSYLSVEAVELSKPNVRKEGAYEVSIDEQLTNIFSVYPYWQKVRFTIAETAVDQQAFTLDNGNGGEPTKRINVLVNTTSGIITETQKFSDYSEYRQARNFIRFIHTGEFYGVWGQTIAGIASLLACLLVYTGVMLSWRRWRRSQQAKLNETMCSST